MAETKKKGDVSGNITLAMKVFEEHGDFIRTIIRFHVKNEAEGEDLFQDFFLFLVSKPIPEEVQNVRGFLYRVVSDQIKDALRRIDCYQRRICRYAERHKRIIENCPKNVVIEVEETKKMLELIRRRLPSKEAWAVTLRYGNNCNIGEVADKMGIKPRSVSRYVSAGLKKIRHAFDVNGDNSYDSI
ncbi:MAG: RNA polymerase sigma factor [Planctomycetota bacterium]